MPNSGAAVRIGGDKAFYSPPTDHIQLPPDGAFRGPHEWVATALHELGHWTGYGSRLNRDMGKRFGSAGYAMEETRAELASAFLAGELGIPADIPNHASYIRNWLKPFGIGSNPSRTTSARSSGPQPTPRKSLSGYSTTTLLTPHASPRVALIRRNLSFGISPSDWQRLVESGPSLPVLNSIRP
jgi:hypothetical protein